MDRAAVLLWMQLLLVGWGLPQTTETVYNDALAVQWQWGVWNCAEGIPPQVDLAQTVMVHSGSAAIEIDFQCDGGWGAFGLDRRAPDWAEIYYMYPNQYVSVNFYFNPGSDPGQAANLVLTLDNGNDPVNLSNHIGAMAPNTWYPVTIPLHQLNTGEDRFFRLYFFNRGDTQPHFFIDDLSFQWLADTTVPVISDLAVNGIDQEEVLVQWFTDEYTRCTLSCTAGGPSLQLEEDDFSKYHQVQLSGLTPETTYAIRIEAFDHQIQGTPNSSSLDTGFSTLPADQAPPVISRVMVGEVHSSWVQIQWETDEPADSTIFYGQDQYTLQAHDDSLKTSHLLTLTGLEAKTTYQYRVASRDQYNNQGGYSEIPPLLVTTTDYPTATLTVDADRPVHACGPNMLGANLGNWTFYWGRPYPGDMPKMMELTRLIRPGVIRHAGGLMSNSTFWDRYNTQCYPTKCPGQGSARTYYSPRQDGVDVCGEYPQIVPAAYRTAYQADEIDSLAVLADYVGAEVMIEVNLSTCHPEMWADMVRYCNVEHDYNFRYWELSNEMDLVNVNGSPLAVVGQEYVSRFKRYHQALKAVDPHIRIVGPTSGAHEEDGYFNPFANLIDPLTQDPEVRQDQMLDVFSYHLYPFWNGQTPVTWEDLVRYSNGSSQRSREHMNSCPATKRDLLDQRGFPDSLIAITEYNAIAADNLSLFCHNHGNALFMADTLARLTYHGADMILNWELYDLPSATSFGIISHGESYINYLGEVTDNCFPTPAWYTYFMYAQLFGDYLVQTGSSMEDRLSVWASTDTQDPDSLKLMVVNLGDESVNTTIQLNGFSAGSGIYFELTNPAFIGAENKEAVVSGSGINELEIDSSSVAQILSTAQAILDSGIAVDVSNLDRINRVFPAYSATCIHLFMTTGDLNLDGNIDVVDLGILHHYLAGNLDPSDAPFKSRLPAADMDGDGEVDAADLQALAGLLSEK